MIQLRAHNAQGDNFNYCVYVHVTREGAVLKLSVVRYYKELDKTEELYTMTARDANDARTQMRKKKLRMMQVFSGRTLIAL